MGAVLGNDRDLSLTTEGLVVIRYDPTVLGTPGLRMGLGRSVVAWVALWEDLP